MVQETQMNWKALKATALDMLILLLIIIVVGGFIGGMGLLFLAIHPALAMIYVAIIAMCCIAHTAWESYKANGG
jgi:hypothetical protein